MPTQTPTSFASAAAATNAGDNTSSSRPSGSNGDWSRRPNGATQTFRRPSQLNTNSNTKDSASREVSTPTTTPYVPPHLNSAFQSTFARTAASSDFRYSREQMLEIFRNQDEESLSNGLLQSSLNEGWDPSKTTRSDWNRKDESRDQQQSGPDLCWTFENSTQPIGLIEMDEEEKELFTTSVNSPLKGPTQVGKDGSGLNGRKTSMNQGQGIPSSLKTDRPGPRRRETSDSIGGGLGTPTFNKRDDATPLTPHSSLLRRRTDLKDNLTGSPLDKSSRLEGGIDTTSPFSSWKRNVSGGPMSAGLTGPSSPWASAGPPQSAGFGAFGNFSYDATSTTSAAPGEKRMGFGSMRGESRFKGLMSKDSSEDVGGKAKDKSMLGLEKLAESYLDRQGESRSQPSQGEGIGSAALLDDNGSSSNAPGSEKKQFNDLGFGNFESPSHSSTGRGMHDSANLQDNETTSLSGTNPYQSPESESRHSSAIPDDDHGNMGTFNSRMQARQQNVNFDGPGERGQSSSVGPQRNFPPLAGLGSLASLSGNSPWSTTTPGGFGQSRTNQPLGSGIFSSMADISSPGGAFGTPTNSAFPTNRSKMGALFPEHAREGSNDIGDAFGSRGASTSSFPFTSADYQQNFQQRRSLLDDLFEDTTSSNEHHRDFSQTSNPGHQQISSSSGPSPQYGRSPEPSQPPPAQQRQMVMPDRIRWIYRDPSGNTQGPFTGLEMHDWYKAGFFSPELQVKKVEEKEYEPLAQLIRRIGNSREPFLVPQIGIPHGPPSSALGTPAGNANLGITPPFGNSFPSFGTTLTADQQNALERRKQEEQILMARQKEHLQQHQSLMRNMMPNMPFPATQPPLHHQASGQSLHSQPSFGNIASTGGFPNQSLVNQSGAFDRQGLGTDNNFGRDTGLPSSFDRMNLGSSSSAQSGFTGGNLQDFGHSQQVTSMLQDRARLQAQQEQWNAMQKDDGRQSMDRFDQFHQLRAEDQDQARPPSGPIAPPRTQDASPEQQQFEEPSEMESFDGQSLDEEQISNDANQLSMSPLPAPAAQRHRQIIAETLADNSSEQTPIETAGSASVAPWAKETSSSKVPSLLEIQEAESRKAAQQEEVAAAARRQLAEQERLQALQALAMAQAQTAGLPSSANWASNSPAGATSTPSSPWSKPAKLGAPTSAAKKTLAQIQKEEESRKLRAAAAAAAASVTTNPVAPVATPGGKSYANLAGKVAAPATFTAAAGWNVVGSSGKAKAPASPIIPPPTRTVSSGVVSSAAKTRQQPTRSTTMTNTAQAASDAFQKWVKNSLATGLNSSINVEDFVKNLISYPLEEDLISDAIYGNSETLDGRRFAREFIQRKKDVDKGKTIDATGSNFIMGGSDAKGASGGWSEVAKKIPAPTREDPASNFKVVAAKKKGKR